MMAHPFAGDDQPEGRPLYESYRLSEAKDGYLIYFAATDAEMYALFRAVGYPEWAKDSRFASAEQRAMRENDIALGEKIEATMREWTTEELLKRLQAEDVAFAPVLDLDQLFEDEQLRHDESILDFEYPTVGLYCQARPAARFDKTRQGPGRYMPPLHGEHAEEVLCALGSGESEVEKMREDGVILTAT